MGCGCALLFVTLSHRRRQKQKFLELFCVVLVVDFGLVWFGFFFLSPPPRSGFCGCGRMSRLNMNSDTGGWLQLFNLMNDFGKI